MSDSIWSCRFCNHINDWGEHVCSLCGRSSYESAAEFLWPLLPTNKQDEITTLRAEREVAEARCVELEADVQYYRDGIVREGQDPDELRDEIITLRAKLDAAEKDKRTVMDDFQRVSALQVTELEELENELATLRKENQAARKALEIICPAEDGFTENFDLLADMGILVEVPADEVFKEEWASDTMWVWKWIAEAEKGGE